MSAPLRLGGRVTTADGAGITWSVAEGARGRRWREALERDGALIRSVLLETTPNGRPSRLEVATAAGMLTVHPERAERELHGNMVAPSGIRHLRFDWSPDHELFVPGSAVCAAAALGHLARSIAVGGSRRVVMLRIDDALEPRQVAWTAVRTGEVDWTLRSTGGDEERRLSLDPATGLVELPDATTWPLELA